MARASSEISEGDDEPSLGSTGQGGGGPISYMIPVVSAHGEMIHDCEGDEHDGKEPVGDEEPSLGFLERHASLYGNGRDQTGNQERICDGRPDELEDEHDGAEPDEDGEPSLGSFDRMVSQLSSWKQLTGWYPGSDREQDDCDDEEDDPEEESEPSGIGDTDGLQEQHSGRVFPSGLKIEGVE